MQLLSGLKAAATGVGSGSALNFCTTCKSWGVARRWYKEQDLDTRDQASHRDRHTGLETHPASCYRSLLTSFRYLIWTVIFTLTKGFLS